MEINTTPLPGERRPRPGPVTDADDERLAGLRRRVVEPVVSSMLSQQEIHALSVHWGINGRAGDVWVLLGTPSDHYTDWLPSPCWHVEPLEMDPPASEAQIADHLADRLQDWIAESSFGWGQLRRTDYQLPQD